MIAVIADGADARGFALAGARVIRCTTAAQVAQAIDAVTRQPPPAAVLLVSSAAYALAADAVDAMRDRRHVPSVLVLPPEEHVA